MKFNALVAIAFLIPLLQCTSLREEPVYDLSSIDITVCRTSNLLFDEEWDEPLVKLRYPRMVYADEFTNFPKIRPNDNRVPAGILKDDTLTVELYVAWGDFYIEDESRPGLHMTAIGEKGKPLTIPAPLIRVETGTVVRATVYNSLPDSTITFFGLQSRPSENADSLFILPGKSKVVEFNAGEPGTYLYWATLGKHVSAGTSDEREQLSGAFVIDPVGTKVKDRILVMNIFSLALPDNDTVGFLESLTINGRSWPYTELFEPSVGDIMRWKVINSSIRNHPMHLHGFYYDVLSRGTVLKDSIYKTEGRRTVVTEFMTGRTTMDMEWVPTRPGRWLFHCHLSFHVSSELRLPDGTSGEHNHMAGLVTGIDVKPGPTDLIWKGENREITLYANNYYEAGTVKNGFTTDKSFQPKPGERTTPGSLIVLQQFQPTYITVMNRMDEATSVHWHGLEIDSWSDGVPDWSSSDGKTSPAIQPREKFRYKLALMRKGSFIYHSHLDDVHQLTSGLYGPLIVLGKGEKFDPKTDHIYIVGWKVPEPLSWADLELNGSDTQSDKHTQVGITHRIRLMNIAPAGRMRIRMEKDGKIHPIKIIAKDGADLPEIQQVFIESSFRYGVGETADFEFLPEVPGTYKLYFWNNNPKNFWVQNWIVEPK